MEYTSGLLQLCPSYVQVLELFAVMTRIEGGDAKAVMIYAKRGAAQILELFSTSGI
jgi:hypothetical protein